MWEITKIHNSYDKIGINTLFWHRAKVYFMCIKPLWWLITVPIMNTIHWFISDISLQTYKIYDKMMDTNATFWHLAKVYLHFQVPSVVDNYEIWTKSTHSFLRYHNKHTKCKKNLAIITQIWHRVKYYFTYISNTWYLITVPNRNKSNPFFSELSQQIQQMYEKLATIAIIKTQKFIKKWP